MAFLHQLKNALFLRAEVHDYLDMTEQNFQISHPQIKQKAYLISISYLQ